MSGNVAVGFVFVVLQNAALKEKKINYTHLTQQTAADANKYSLATF